MARKNFTLFTVKVDRISERGFHDFTIPGTEFHGWWCPDADSRIRLDLWEGKKSVAGTSFDNASDMFDYLKELTKSTGKKVW